MDATLPPIEDLIACPHCDALHRVTSLAAHERARCARCGALLIAARERSFIHVLALAMTSTFLMLAAIFFPFLSISSHGFGHESSVFEVAMAFSDGWVAPLSFAVLTAIAGLPLLRLIGVIYTLWPVARGRAPWRFARPVFRLVEQMQPWSMAEIFVMGTGVALVKIGGLASISFGPAFWALCSLIIVNLLQNIYMSKWAIWEVIGRK